MKQLNCPYMTVLFGVCVRNLILTHASAGTVYCHNLKHTLNVYKVHIRCEMHAVSQCVWFEVEHLAIWIIFVFNGLH